MPRKTYTPEQIILKLREAEVHKAEGMTARNAARQIGVTEQTYYRWRKEYGGMKVNQAKRLKVIEKENSRLKRLDLPPLFGPLPKLVMAPSFGLLLLRGVA